MKQKNNMPIPPAQLWIGQDKILITHVIDILQNIFCPHNDCKNCAICTQIKNQQHHSIIWLYPEKQYTLDQIKVIFRTISFKLDAHEKTFFILQKSDFLSDACANSLLKSVEDPPQGYHFIFLAQRLSQILPTIQSRCIIKNFYSETSISPLQQILEIFKADTLSTPSYFLKILDEEKPNERETVEILDHLLTYWLKQEKVYLEKNKQYEYQNTKQMVSKIKNALQKPPMPGSSKIFWRNFYLTFQQSL